MNTVRISLSPNQIQQLKEYHDWAEKESTDLSLTDYWETHSKKIAIKFERNSVTLTGESGFYFPQYSSLYRRLRHFAAQLPTNLSYWNFICFRKIFNRPYDFLTTYSKAYDSVRKHDPVLLWTPSQKRMDWENLQNTVLDFTTFKGMKYKWPAFKTHILADTTIKSYFYLQLIEDKIKQLKNATVCEIGPGTGNMASLFHHHFNSKLFLVDLPKTFFFSFAFLAQSCPQAKIALPNETSNKNFNANDYDIIMLTPQQTYQMQDQSMDLVTNVHSMQEMNSETISSYFDLTDRIIKPHGHFFCANRMEKIMDEKVMRFSDYPWRPKTHTVIFEQDPLMRLVNLCPSYIRMEQYL
jgi:putative sugar O-methyltransferase